MNKEIYVDDLLQIGAPAIIPLSKEYFPRVETCAICSTHLVESLYTERDTPKDVLNIQFGEKNNSWIEGKEVFCPHCKLIYKYPLTDLDILARYVANAERGGILAMKLSQDFSFSEFDPESSMMLSKGEAVYAASTSSVEKLYKLKRGYTEATAYKDIGEGKFAIKMKKDEAWDEIPSFACHLSLSDLFRGIAPVKIPANILLIAGLKKKSESRTE